MRPSAGATGGPSTSATLPFSRRHFTYLKLQFLLC